MHYRLLATLVVVIVPATAFGHDSPTQNNPHALDSRVFPEDVQPVVERARSHWANGDWAASLSDIDLARQLGANMPELDVLEGRAQLQAKHFRSALTSLDRYAKHQPRHAVVHLLRARALAALDSSIALSVYRLAIDLADKPGPSLFLEAAEVAGQRPATEDALAIIELGLERRGSIATLQAKAIELELALGRPEAALERVSELIVRAARPEPWLVHQGDILWNLGRTAEARSSYKAAVIAIENLPTTRRNGARTAQLRIHANARLHSARAMDSDQGTP